MIQGHLVKSKWKTFTRQCFLIYQNWIQTIVSQDILHAFWLSKIHYQLSYEIKISYVWAYYMDINSWQMWGHI